MAILFQSRKSKVENLLSKAKPFEEDYRKLEIRPLSTLLKTLLKGLQSIQKTDNKDELDAALKNLKKYLKKVLETIEQDERIKRVNTIINTTEIVSQKQDLLETKEALHEILWSEIQKTTVDLGKVLKQLSLQKEELSSVFHEDSKLLEKERHGEISKRLGAFKKAKDTLQESENFIKGKVTQQLEFFKELLAACQTFKKSENISVEKISGIYDHLKDAFKKINHAFISPKITEQYIKLGDTLEQIPRLLEDETLLENKPRLFSKAFEVLCETLRLSIPNLEGAKEEIGLLTKHDLSLLKPELQREICGYLESLEDHLRDADFLLKKIDFEQLGIIQQLKFFKELLAACQTFKKSENISVEEISGIYNHLKDAFKKINHAFISPKITEQYIELGDTLKQIPRLLKDETLLENKPRLFSKAFEVLCETLRLSIPNLEGAKEEIGLLTKHDLSLLKPELQREICGYLESLKKDIKDHLRDADFLLKKEELRYRTCWINLLIDVFHRLVRLKEAQTEQEKIKSFEDLRIPCQKMQGLLNTSTEDNESAQKLIRDILEEPSDKSKLIDKVNNFHEQAERLLKKVFGIITLNEPPLKGLLKQLRSMEKSINKASDRLDADLLEDARTNLKHIDYLIFEIKFIALKIQKKLDFFRKALSTYHAAHQIDEKSTLETLKSFMVSFKELAASSKDFESLFKKTEEDGEVSIHLNVEDGEMLLNLNVEDENVPLENKINAIRATIIEIFFFIFESNKNELKDSANELCHMEETDTVFVSIEELSKDTNAFSDLEPKFYGRLKHYYDEIVSLGDEISKLESLDTLRLLEDGNSNISSRPLSPA